MTKPFAQFACLLLVAPVVCFAVDKAASATSKQVVVHVATLQNGFSIRFDHSQQRGSASRLFLDPQETSFVDVPGADIASVAEEAPPPLPQQSASKPKPVDIPTAVASASDRHGIDADLLYSVIRAESNFNPHAISPKGARGLMQLMPATAGKLGVTDAFDTASNVEAGTKYLRELLDRYHYDLAKALAAYNAGPARVDQYHGVPPYYETRAYVAQIIRDYNKAVLSRRSSGGTKRAVPNSSTSSSGK